MLRGAAIKAKRCRTCGKRRRISSFRLLTRGAERPPEKRGSSSFHVDCLKCERGVMKARMAAYREADPRRSSDQYWSWKLKTWYGITPEMYDSAFRAQHGCCKVCGRHQSVLKRKLSVDHCHQTGMFRGLLCDGCNRGIGMLQENPELLRKAANYLESDATNLRALG